MQRAEDLLDRHPTYFLGNPATFNVLPITFYHPRTGFNFGFQLQLHSRAVTPYLYRISLQMLASNKGSHKHRLLFDYPQIGKSGFGLRVQAEWERDLSASYYGIGNDSDFHSSFVTQDSRQYIDEDFYLYNLRQPRLVILGYRKIYRDLLVGFGAGIEATEPQLKTGEETSFLAQERPFGYLGGFDRLLSTRLNLDRRSSDIFPVSGFVTELAIEHHFASIDDDVSPRGGPQKIVRRQVNFQRLTFSSAFFRPLHGDKLILANKFAFETILGNAPYYALGEMGGEKTIHGLGGSQSLRGYRSRRFQDKVKMITLSELRFKAHRFILLRHKFDIVLTTFFDTGRVWDNLEDLENLTINNVHTTQGFGAWLNLDDNLNIRFDLGHSPEGWKPYLRFGTAF